jgi:hypothetical protein
MIALLVASGAVEFLVGGTVNQAFNGSRQYR